MKSVQLLIVLFLSLLLGSTLVAQSQLPYGFPNTERSKVSLNLGWKFHLGEVEGNPEEVAFNDDQWEEVSVPHTSQLVSYHLDSVKETWVQEKYLRDIGWYRKKLVINASSNHKVFLEFEGVHNATELWVNGRYVGRYAVNGYIPFHFDITDFVVSGKENLLVVKADNRFDSGIAPDPHKTDYVKFGGIYRDVYLVTSDKLHVSFNWEAFDAGVHITTPAVKKRNGTVSVKTTVKNDYASPQRCKVVTRIIDATGHVVKRLTSEMTIVSGGQYTFRQTVSITEDFHLWSIDNPYLYRVNSIVYKEGELVDFVENKFGFRWFNLVEGKGFVLNGEPIFLIGVNRHQNYPNIGDAVPNSLHYQEALMYKEAGINIIRLSHYTQDDAFIEACDALGILVYEEASTWIDWGDDVWWGNLEQAFRVTVRNHRNHPSIVFWGAGINHRGPVPVLQNAAKEEDPYRLTASASSPWNGVKNAGVTDVHATMDYRRSEWPESDFTMVMEHGSSANAESNQFHISRYKSSKQNIAAIAWLGADYNHLQPEDRQRDYLTNYAVLSAYRVPKPVYYWYQSELVEKPMVHIADETASKDGKIRVFSNGQEVALYLDGQLIARQKPDGDAHKVHLDHPSFTFRHPWSHGTLRAVAYRNGREIASHKRTKAKDPYKIKLYTDNEEIPLIAGGSDLKMVRAAVLDRNNEVVTDAKQKISFSVSGTGGILDDGKVDANPATLYNGIATIYLKGSNGPGKISVTASSKGLKSASLDINTVTFKDNVILNTAMPIYDYPIIRVDLGGEKQLVQHEWKSWTGKNEDDLSIKFEEYNDAMIRISADTTVTWVGEESSMLGDIGFVGADGIYIEKGKITLNISGLKQGVYLLESYHHARRDEAKFPYKVKVVVEDSKGTFERVSDDHGLDHHSNISSGERKPLFVKSRLYSNGDNDITITFENTRTNAEIWLNGFVLLKI